MTGAPKTSDARLLRRILAYLRPHWRLLSAGILLIPVAIGFELAQPYVLKVAIDSHIEPAALDGIGVLAGLYVALVLLQAAAGALQALCLTLVGEKSMRDLRLDMYRHVMAQRLSVFDHTPIGQLLTRMTSDVQAINDAFALGMVEILFDLVKLVAVIVLMLALNAKLALMCFLSAPLLAVCIALTRKSMRNAFQEVRAKLAATGAYLSEVLAGMKVVQLFTREARVQSEFDELNHGYRDSSVRAAWSSAFLSSAVEAIGTVAVAAIAYYASGRMDSAVTVGLIVAFIEYVRKAFLPIRQLAERFTSLQSAFAAAERIMSVLDSDEPDAAIATVVADRSNDGTSIEFEDVGFAYRPDTPVLRGLSLAIEKGESVAIVGRTGSGKSTVVRLLTRLYEANSGVIRFEGRDIRGLSAEELRTRISVVSQDVFVFGGTVADNILIANPEASREDVDRALARVGADVALARKECDADAEVAERGANFSAGERQLISFARALVRDPEVLVLDEATAHVDPESERMIEKGIAALMNDRTSIVIAHRLSTVRRADRIIVVDNGMIAEQGTHAELIRAGGLYAQLEGTVLK